MKEIKKLTEEKIDALVELVCEKKNVRCNLPGGGKLNIEKPLPFLLIYRHIDPAEDPATVRLVLSEASYLIIGEEDFEDYQRLIFKLAEALSSEYKSFVLFEMWAGEAGSHSFKIKGPADRIPSTIKELQEELHEMDIFYNRLKIQCLVEDTFDRHPPGRPELLSISELKNSGSLLVGMEIPPVYRSEEKQVYPIFFRSFHSKLVNTLHHAFFDFIRVQTSAGVANYSALGRGHVDDNALKIDRELCEIEKQYEFLWLVSPANIHEIKQTFFDSDYEKVLDYHYRLLPIDPDLLKRKLFNLKIEEVEDPSIAFLFRDKREELDRQITMLNERGTRDFFYNSVRLYKGVEKDLLAQAKNILDEVEESPPPLNGETIKADKFAELTQLEIDRLNKLQPDFSCKVLLREDVNVMMVAHGDLYIPSDYYMPKTEAEALIQHELGTHVLTHYNGKHQKLQQLAYGLADYDALQEGLAVMAEYLVGGLTANRLRTLAARVVAGSALMNGADFQEIFRLLHRNYQMSAERSFNVTSRIMQGGGFLKDIIYLKGLVELREHLQNGGELEPLLIGKLAVKHIEVIKALTDRELLTTAKLLPGYLKRDETVSRLNKIREGLPLPQMVNA